MNIGDDMRKKYKHLLFDADNTLLDFAKTEKYALIDTFRQFNIPYTDALKKRYMEINSFLWKQYEDGKMSREEVIYKRFIDLFNELHIPVDGVYFEDVYQRNLGKGHYLVDDALDVVRNLSEYFQLHIVTNGVSETQYKRLKDSGLYNYFNNIFVSEEIGYRKPMKEYFDYCFDHIQNIDVSEVLIIGDSLSSDMQGGINSSIDTCWFNPKHSKNVNNLNITYEIDLLCDLYDILCISNDK